MTSPIRLHLLVEPEHQGRRLDLYLAWACPDRSRSALTKLVRAGAVQVNGRPPRKPGQLLEAGDAVDVSLPPPEPMEPVPEHRPLSVLYEDEEVLAIDKPAGLAVYPGAGRPTGTLVNALLGHGGTLSRLGGADRPGIVHRLDRDTSGVLLVAKTDAAHEALARQFQERTVEKVYLALLRGRLAAAEGTIEAPIGRDPYNRRRMAVVIGGREAVTAYRVLAQDGGYALVEARPRTGRTHQVRVHFASIGHPVAGDPVYGRGPADPTPRLFLHAHRLTFRHPRTGEPTVVLSPLPADLEEALRGLRGA